MRTSPSRSLSYSVCFSARLCSLVYVRNVYALRLTRVRLSRRACLNIRKNATSNKSRERRRIYLARKTQTELKGIDLEIYLKGARGMREFRVKKLAASVNSFFLFLSKVREDFREKSRRFDLSRYNLDRNIYSRGYIQICDFARNKLELFSPLNRVLHARVRVRVCEG